MTGRSSGPGGPRRGAASDSTASTRPALGRHAQDFEAWADRPPRVPDVTLEPLVADFAMPLDLPPLDGIVMAPSAPGDGYGPISGS